MTDKFELFAKKNIPHRDWDNLKELWLAHMPIFQSPLSPPDPTLDRFLDLDQLLTSIGNDMQVRNELPGTRGLMFHEAIFLFHKAVNVISAAEVHASSGMLTWSLASAYQGAFFAAKSIMRLLGVASVSPPGKNDWIVDIFPEPSNPTSSQKRLGLRPGAIMEFNKPATKIEHKQTWILFQRLMRVTKFGDKALNDVAVALKSTTIDAGDFSRQRNALHYHHTWFYNDLYRPDQDITFGVLSSLSEDRLTFTQERSDFTMILAFFLLNLGIQMLNTFSPLTPKLGSQIEIIKSSLDTSRHPLYSLLLRSLGT